MQRRCHRGRVAEGYRGFAERVRLLERAGGRQTQAMLPYVPILCQVFTLVPFERPVENSGEAKSPTRKPGVWGTRRCLHL
jgi:hypothetical protein